MRSFFMHRCGVCDSSNGRVYYWAALAAKLSAQKALNCCKNERGVKVARRFLLYVSALIYMSAHADISLVDVKMPDSSDVFARVKDSLIIVQCDDSSGSGFIMEMEEGKKYFITNKHVIEGQKRVAAFLLNGKELQLGSFQVATNRDLVRFALRKDAPNGLKGIEGEPNLGENIYVFGNSDGSGVATDLKGKILGVGPEIIEVDAKFVRGNSGSAVLNDNGEVVGVATFATMDANPNDWTKSDTRFKDVRRFAVRLTEVVWESMRYSEFHKRALAQKEKSLEEKRIKPQLSARFIAPKLQVIKRTGWGGDALDGNVVMSLYEMPKTFKNPIVRVCFMFKSNRGYRVKSYVITEMQGKNRVGAHFHQSAPVFSYGETSRGPWNIGNGRYVYYFEGLSYNQADFPASNLKKGIMYWCGKLESYSGEHPWGDGIVCFRLECWQNGSLAGVYNSKNPVELNAKGFPVDWFIKDKYPEKFYYED